MEASRRDGEKGLDTFIFVLIIVCIPISACISISISICISKSTSYHIMKPEIRSLGVRTWIPARDEFGQEAEFELSMAKERQKKVRFLCRCFRVQGLGMCTTALPQKRGFGLAALLAECCFLQAEADKEVAKQLEVELLKQWLCTIT